MFVRPMVYEKGIARASRVGDGILANPQITAIAADSAQTLTAAGILGGIITHATHTASRTDTTDTAVNILAAMPDMDIGDTYMFTVASLAAFTIIVAGGVGVTASGNLTVLANGAKNFVLVKTSATTMNLIGL
jgi:hypothetical protein